ncbi:Mitochondrial outer membrane protein porin [Cyberlindnera fabianii]|uniref:Mitochondrial outer membrane protein porin n=1 Tax=Cyberlindnera fabianii TaxID=36022 RepID=A0A1V2LD40_CYBFA|nr:Mitochondrial outer membrane protein porin [Cyberlindnera fabianii]
MNDDQLVHNQNGLLNKDFYHTAPAALEVSTRAPNGVSFTTRGKQSPKDGSLAGNVEAKFSDKSTGLTLTQGWNTANALDTKIELADALTPGLKAELLTSLIPNASKGAKLNLIFNHPSATARAFFDLLKGPSFVGDITVGHDSFTAGAEVGYDIASGKVTRYSTALGYAQPAYNVSVTATSNLSVFSAAYYHRVSPITEVGAKATWDSKADAAAGKAVGIETAVKHILDDTAFVKAKVADSGITAVSYNQVLRPGVKLGLGASFDALKLAEPVHQLGWSLTFTA